MPSSKCFLVLFFCLCDELVGNSLPFSFFGFLFFFGFTLFLLLSILDVELEHESFHLWLLLCLYTGVFAQTRYTADEFIPFFLVNDATFVLIDLFELFVKGLLVLSGKIVWLVECLGLWILYLSEVRVVRCNLGPSVSDVLRLLPV